MSSGQLRDHSSPGGAHSLVPRAAEVVLVGDKVLEHENMEALVEGSSGPGGGHIPVPPQEEPIGEGVNGQENMAGLG